MRYRNRHINIIFIVIAGINLLLSTPATAQNLISAHPADSDDAKSVFVNPAMLLYHPAQILMGMKVFHVGFMEHDKLAFRNDFVYASSPYLLNRYLVLAVSGQHFGIPLYSQTYINVQGAFRLSNTLSLGLNYNVFQQAYDESNFNIIDAADPVFAKGTSKISHSIGIGAAFAIRYNLNFGIAWNHINRPDISLAGAGIRQPQRFDFGITYFYGFVGTVINVNWCERSTSLTWLFQYKFPERGFIRAGYEINSAKLEGQLQLVQGLSLNYGYEYPLFELNEISAGSHHIGLIYAFHQKQLASETRRYSDGLMENPDITITQDQLKIIRKKIAQTVSATIKAEQLNTINAVHLAVADTSICDRYFCHQNYDHVIYVDDTVPLSKITTKYSDYLQAIANGLTGVPDKAAVFFHSNASRAHVDEIQNYFVNRHLDIHQTKLCAAGDDSLNLHEYQRTATVFVPEVIKFKIRAPRRLPLKKWIIEITNSAGHPIHTIEGYGKISAVIKWNWQESIPLLPPDVYRYCLIWTDANGLAHKTDIKYFTVQHIQRHLIIEITNEAKQNVGYVEKLE